MAALTPTLPRQKSSLRVVLAMLWRDKFATAAVIFLALAVLCAFLGPALLGEAATKQNLRGRNLAPFTLDHGWLMILGADALGRPLLARIVVAAQNTLLIAAGAVTYALPAPATTATSRGVQPKSSVVTNGSAATNSAPSVSTAPTSRHGAAKGGSRSSCQAAAEADAAAQRRGLAGGQRQQL